MAPKRIYPLPGHNSRNTWRLLVISFLPVVVGVLAMLLGRGIPFFIGGSAFILVGLFFIWTLLRTNWVASIYRKGTAKAEGTIEKRYTKNKKGGHAHVTIDYKVYGFNITFVPSDAKKSRKITAALEGGGPFFSKLATGDKVIIEYAKDNPLIFVLEGEDRW